MKRLFLLLITIMSIYTYTGNASPIIVDKPILLLYNQKSIKTDVPPAIVENRCLVPARAFFENIGASVNWVSDISRVDVSMGKQQISLTIGKKAAYVDGAVVSMDVPASIIGGRTMIPVRFISESLGMSVNWKQSPPTVEITNSNIIGVVKEIKTSSNQDNVITTINLSTPPTKHSAYYLSNPTRLVVDIYGLKSGITKPLMNINANGVEKLRIGDHQGFVRLVFDVEKELDYNIVQSKSKTDISIYFAPPLTPPSIPSGTPAPKKDGFMVAIDVGHGGIDPGAIAKFEDNKILEKDLNLDIALKLKILLEKKGVQVYLTRTTDETVELRERPDLCNATNADLMLSIHNNAIASPEIKGVMTIYEPTKLESEINSKSLADIVQRELVEALGAYDMGKREVGGYIVLKYAKIPAVIVEVGFMTNQEELKKLNDENYRQLAAQGLANAVDKVMAMKK